MKTLSPGRAAWRRAIEDPILRDLPYRIETNEYGQFVMSPVARVHGRRQIEIGALLRQHVRKPGVVAVEIGIETPKGVKAPDVSWTSDARWKREPEEDATGIAPGICVEVLSRWDTKTEMDEKRELYLACGAEEVWTCDSEGRMRFFGPEGEMQRSKLAPRFPETIE